MVRGARWAWGHRPDVTNKPSGVGGIGNVSKVQRNHWGKGKLPGFKDGKAVEQGGTKKFVWERLDDIKVSRIGLSESLNRNFQEGRDYVLQIVSVPEIGSTTAVTG